VKLLEDIGNSVFKAKPSSEARKADTYTRRTKKQMRRKVPDKFCERLQGRTLFLYSFSAA